MQRLLRPGNLTTLALVVLCLGLVLTGLAQGLFTGGEPLEELQVTASGEASELDLSRRTFELPPSHSYAAITDRPIFNETRRPEPDDERVAGADGGKGQSGQQQAQQQAKLDVTVEGIVITPDQRIAMIKDNKSSQTATLHEGMSAPGKMSQWTLKRILPRRVVFSGGGNRTASVDLSVYKSALAGGGSGQGGQGSGISGSSSGGSQSAASRAERIRQKVAEARKRRLERLREARERNESKQ